MFRCYCLITLILILSGSVSVAGEDSSGGRTEEPIEFHRDIAPILRAKCQACHGGNFSEGDLKLDQFEHLMQGGGSGPPVIPEDSAKSLLYLTASRQTEPQMPPLPNDLGIPAVTEQELTLIKRWIDGGAIAGKPGKTKRTRWRPIPESQKQVYDMALSPDQRILAASHANRVHLYDLLTRKESGRLTIPDWNGAADRDFVFAVAFSPDGERIATGGYRNAKVWKKQVPVARHSHSFETPVQLVRHDSSKTHIAVLTDRSELFLWNPASGGQPLLIVRDPASAPLIDLAFSPSGERCVTVTTAGELTLLDSQTGEKVSQRRIPEGVRAILCGPEEVGIITSHDDEQLRVWNWGLFNSTEETPLSSPVKEWKHPAGPPFALAMIASDMAGGKSELLTAGTDSQIRRWNLQDGSVIWEKPVTGQVEFLTTSPSGDRILFSNGNGEVHWWNGKGEPVATGKGIAAVVRENFQAERRLELATRKQQRASEKIKQAEEELKDRQAQREAAAKERETADEQLATQSAALKVILTDLEKLKEKLTAAPDDATIKSELDKREKDRVAQQERVDKENAASRAATRKFLHAQQGVEFGEEQVRRRRSLEEEANQELEFARQAAAVARQQLDQSGNPIQSLTVSREENLVYAASSGEPVRAWSLSSGDAVDGPSFTGRHFRHLIALAGQQLLTIDSQGTAVVWDVTPRWELEVILGPTGSERDDLDSSRIEHRVNAIAFHPDGQHLVTGGGEPSRNGEVLIWNLSSPTNPVELKEAHSDSVLGVQFSLDGRKLVTCGADRFCKLFDFENRTLQTSFEGHTDHVMGITLSLDGERLGSSGADRLIKIWEVESGELRKTIDNSTHQVTRVQFIDPYGNRILSAGGDRQVRLHVTESGKSERSFIGAEDFVYSTLSTLNGDHIIAAGEEGIIRIWDAQTGEPVGTLSPVPQQLTP